MTKRQEEEPAPASFGRPARYGVDSLGLATLIGVVAVLVIAFASWRDVDRIDRSLGERLDKLEARIDQMGSRPPAQAQQRGPDPNRVYTVRTDGAPVRGDVGAPVTIAEFSDFQ
jgi:protein-disulfide isomerase